MLVVKWLGGASLIALPTTLAAQQASAPAEPGPPAPQSAPAAATAPTPAPAPVPSAPRGGRTPGGAPAGAQTAQAAAAGQDDAGEEPDVIVQGRRTQPGAVIGDIPPEQQLGPADIRSYGVSSVADLLTELAPQTGSVRGQGGRPVVLLNGRRIGNFSEIRDIPTEAILRVDILPEEVALKYGYSADQRVVNFVLRSRFQAITSELAGTVPTEGGRFGINPQTDILKIAHGGRFNLHLNYNASTQLLESDRDIASNPSLFSVPGNVVATGSSVFGVPAAAAGGPVSASQFTATGQTTTDPSRYRTLLPATSDFQLNTIYATGIGKTSVTLNGQIDATNSRSLQGLATTALALPQGNPFNPFGAPVTVDRALDGFSPLQQRTEGITGHLGATFNGDRGKWRYTLTGTYDRTQSRTETDIGVDASALQAALNGNGASANPFAAIVPGALVGPAASAWARSTSNVEAVDALVSGPILRLPAGPLSTSIHASGTFTTLDSNAYRFGLAQTGYVTRDDGNGRINVDIPIASRREGFLSRLGELSANVNASVNQLSDFGTLTEVGYGANWAPITPVRFIVSHTDRDEAPSANQLVDPVVTTPNVRVFDYVNGQTVTVTQTTGGNPLLSSDSRHTTKVGLTLKPSAKKDFTFTADYVTTRTDNAISSFPSASAAIEAAFPDRFTRDGAGTLLAVDTRPVNFAREDSQVLRFGFNFSVPLKSKIQREIEAFRAGKGPNPFRSLFPNGRPAPVQSVFGGTLFGGQRPAQSAGTGGGAGSGQSAAGTNSASGAAPATGAQGAPGVAPAGGAPGEGPGGSGGAGGPPPGGGFGGGGFGGGGRGGGGRGGFGRGGFGGGNAGGRLQFALYHTWYFEDSVLVRQGGPRLDALNGDVIGSGTGGGQPRHVLEAQAGYTNNGFGVRASGNYQTSTTVNGTSLGATAGNTGTLDFGSLATLDLRLFADLSQQLHYVVKHPWARGVRLTLGVTNLFDSRQRVTDATGTTPISFQPDYLNPLGRTVRLSVRKLLF